MKLENDDGEVAGYLLLVAEGKVVISVEILHKVLDFLVSNVINSIISEELDDLLGGDKFIPRAPVEPLEGNVGAAY